MCCQSIDPGIAHSGMILVVYSNHQIAQGLLPNCLLQAKEEPCVKPAASAGPQYCQERGAPHKEQGSALVTLMLSVFLNNSTNVLGKSLFICRSLNQTVTHIAFVPTWKHRMH